MCGRIGGIFVIDKTFQVEVLKFLLFIEIIPFFFFQLSFLFCLSDFAHPGEHRKFQQVRLRLGDDRGKLGRNCASSIRVHLYCL